MWRLSRPPLVFWLCGVLTRIVTFLFVGVALDMAYVLGFVLVFLHYLGGIDPSGGRASLLTFLIFCKSLGLRLISKREVMGLSLFLSFLKALSRCLQLASFLSFLTEGQ